MNILTDKNHVILEITNLPIGRSGKLLFVGRDSYYDPDAHLNYYLDIECKEEAEKYKWCFDGEIFKINKDYEAPKDDVQIQLEGLQMALAELTMFLAGGGENNDIY